MSRALTALLTGLALTPVVAYAASGSVTLVNSSLWNIHHLYLSNTQNPAWGPDRLGRSVLQTGGSFTLVDVPCGSYDVRIVDEDGDECVVADVGLCGSESFELDNASLLSCIGETATPSAPVMPVAPQPVYTPPARPSLQLVNKSQIAVTQLYIAPLGSTAWGPDQLGATVVYPGDTFTLTDISCGTYNVLMTDPDGGSCTLVNIPLCAQGEQWVLTNYNLQNCAY